MKKETIHQGHRQRLTNLVDNAGLENLSDVQAVEYLLTFVFPRGDVNPLAHRLLNHFGNIANILGSDWEALAQVEGMGERSAKKITHIKKFFDLYVECELNKQVDFEYNSELCDYLEQLLRFKNDEYAYIIGLDSAKRVKMKQRLAIGGRKSVDLDIMNIAKFVSAVRPVYVFLAHNHNDNKALPTENDFTATKRISDFLYTLGLKLVDHFIVGIDGVYSIRNKIYLREYFKD